MNQKNQLEEFREAARLFTQKYTQTPEIAKQLLVDEGILNEDGTLTDEYSQE